MKAAFLFIITFLCFVNLYGQDRVTTQCGQTFDIKIIEQTTKKIKYKLANYNESPELMMSFDDIERIYLESGDSILGSSYNPRKRKPWGINAGLTILPDFDAAVSIGIDYFITSQFAVEANVGNSFGDMYYSVGGKFHLNAINSTRKITPYVGLLYTRWARENMIQVPVGINYISSRGLNISCGVGPQFNFDSGKDIMVELKLGWRLKK